MIEENSVTRQVIANRDEELLKLNLIAECGIETGFSSPTAWKHKTDQAKIVMNRIDTVTNSASVFQAYVCHQRKTGKEDCIRMVKECGRALGAIHKQLRAKCPSTVNAQTQLSDSRKVLLHGDFGFSNIHIGINSEIVIFDPFPDLYSTFHTWEVGPRSFDLGMFASCLIGRISPMGLIFLRKNRIPELIIEFIESYNLESDAVVSVDDVLEDAVHIASSYFQKNTKGLKRLIGKRLWGWNLRLVKKSLPV